MLRAWRYSTLRSAPRVRGSIVIVAPRSRDQPVCPAVCGDKSFWLGGIFVVLGSAPRARGSIDLDLDGRGRRGVCPANAGISRRHVPPRWCKEHLPRIGGDAPSELVALILQPEGVPHLRVCGGCVALGTCQAGNHQVTLHQLGCVSTRAPRRGRHSRLPRECGDLSQASSSMTD